MGSQRTEPLPALASRSASVAGGDLQPRPVDYEFADHVHKEIQRLIGLTVSQVAASQQALRS